MKARSYSLALCGLDVGWRRHRNAVVRSQNLCNLYWVMYGFVLFTKTYTFCSTASNLHVFTLGITWVSNVTNNSLLMLRLHIFICNLSISRLGDITYRRFSRIRLTIQAPHISWNNQSFNPPPTFKNVGDCSPNRPWDRRPCFLYNRFCIERSAKIVFWVDFGGRGKNIWWEPP